MTQHKVSVFQLTFRSPSSVETCLLSERSVLLPTSMMMTSLPRSVRTSSIHLLVWWNELALVMSYTTTATVLSVAHNVLLSHAKIAQRVKTMMIGEEETIN